MRIVQYVEASGQRRVGIVESDHSLRSVPGTGSVYGQSLEAIAEGQGLEAHLRAQPLSKPVDYDAIAAEGRLLSPIDHPDPAHLLITGTGLTHLGSADARNQMHKNATTAVTDSMRMFQMGIEGGKPVPGEVGVQPEWFYKGDGSILAAPYQPLCSPAFALDGGEEPEIAGIYVIGPDGTPYRLGFAIGNEFSDHVMERQNYLYLAHSKLRPCSIGPELALGELAQDVRGTARILRGVGCVWQKPFLSGEANMSHTLANLEQHHFKYAQFRRPGDIHVHFFGTATLSFADGIRLEAGDEVEIEAEGFGRPLRNAYRVAEPAPVVLKSL